MTILGTSSVLPGRLVSTKEICERAHTDRDPAEIEARTGIQTRWFKNDEDTVGSVSARSLKAALDAAGMPAASLRRIILATGVGADAHAPATVNTITAELGIRGTCDGFDMSNSCMGFLTALDLAARCVATDLAPVGVVATDLLSRRIDPKYPRSYVLFGDASGAVIVDRGDGSSGILASHFINDGALRGSVIVNEQRPMEEKEVIQFGASNKQITEEAMEAIVEATKIVLAKANVTTADIDWFLVHQPNGVMFRKMVEAVRAPAEKLIPIVNEVGNIGAATIAVELDRLARQRGPLKGKLALFASVGAGIAYGAMLVRL